MNTSINDLRIVETLDEYQSITSGYGRSSSLKYQTHYDLLINACVRYDRTKKANIAKRGHIYQTTFTQGNDDFIGQIPSDTPIGDPYMGMDTPSEEFYNINTNQSGPPMSARHKLQPRLPRTNQNVKPNTFPKKSPRQKWTGPIYLPSHKYNLLSQEAKDALQKYNVEAIQNFKASRNLNETQVIHTMSEHAQEELLPIIDEEEFQECQEFNTDHDLEPPEEDILEFITSQEHSNDQLDQVLQTYQAYQESQSDNEKSHTQINAHITYHVAQAQDDRIPSTNPGGEPPRDARDSGSARSHSTHLETSSSDRHGHLHGASDGTKLYVRYIHTTDVTYGEFHARTARTTIPK